jgi:hypothetical protein
MVEFFEKIFVNFYYFNLIQLIKFIHYFKYHFKNSYSALKNFFLFNLCLNISRFHFIFFQYFKNHLFMDYFNF